MKDFRTLLILAVTLAAATLVGFLALGYSTAPAKADGYYNSRGAYVHRARARRGYRTPAYDMDRDREYDLCGPGPVRGLGTQWIGKEGALGAAKKDWMERVRFDLGEKYLDLDNAKDFLATCSRVSIGEIAGQVMYRCEMRARPCKGSLEQVEGQR